VTKPPQDQDSLAALRAGWSEAEALWEARQEAAARHAGGGRDEEAAALWAEALRLARAHFAADDPRLATSLANHAHALRRQGGSGPPEGLFDEAQRVWDSSGPWLEALAPERRARSSLFHLRLEAKHPGGYERHARERYRALAAEGRAAIAALREGGEGAGDRLSRWERERPAGYTDARKLMAAALLIA
jgi:hypothetical protein